MVTLKNPRNDCRTAKTPRHLTAHIAVAVSIYQRRQRTMFGVVPVCTQLIGWGVLVVPNAPMDRCYVPRTCALTMIANSVWKHRDDHLDR